MGYTTDFRGSFKLDQPLTLPQYDYLKLFNETRRMKRNARLTLKRVDEARVAAALPVGDEGCYFVGESGMSGQDRGPDILDYNLPPADQPGLWCQWVPTSDGTAIEWDGGEKFYSYVEWIQYIIKHFLTPWGRSLTGKVEWRGEEWEDTGSITIKDNVVTVKAKGVHR